MSLHKAGTLVIDQEVKSDAKAQAWGKLVPVSQGLSSAQITVDSFTIGRNPECTLQIHDKRLSGKHCQIVKFGDKITLTDLSTNGTYIGLKKIGKNKSQQLKDDQQIWLLPPSRVNPTQTLGFKIQFLLERKLKEKQKQEKIKHEQQQNQKEKDKEKKQELKQEVSKQQLKKKEQQDNKANDFAKSIKEQITCSFCFDIMFIPVSVQPCNHRFCGACLTQLVVAKKQQCISCRKDMTTAVRDSIFNSIIEDYLKSHPEQKRTQKEQQQAKQKNIFGHDPIDIKQKIHGKKIPAKVKAVIDPPARVSRRAVRGTRIVRLGSDLSASDDQDTGKKCRQCTHPRNGFQCSSSQIHVGCHTCGKLIANRDDPDLNQCCVICTTNFCNLYFPPCSRTGVKLQLLKNKKGAVKIDAQLLRGNKFEYETIKDYLLSKKQTSKDVFDFMINQIQKKKFSYMFDKKIMKIPPIVAKQVPLTADFAVCDLCWKDLWFQMVLSYRLAIAANLPTAVRDRPICYWGVNCRTMEHNHDHAKRYSHLIFQTRFS